MFSAIMHSSDSNYKMATIVRNIIHIQMAVKRDGPDTNFGYVCSDLDLGNDLGSRS